jgi:hypothetical protein
MTRKTGVLLFAALAGIGVVAGCFFARSESGGHWLSAIMGSAKSNVVRASAAAGTSSSAASPENEARRENLRLQMLALAAGEHWDNKYKDYTLAQLEELRDALEDSILVRTQDVFEAQFAAGKYEVIGTGPVYSAKDFNPYDVYWVRIDPSGPIMKSTLPEEDFPEIYQVKALSAWIQHRIYHMRADQRK